MTGLPGVCNRMTDVESANTKVYAGALLMMDGNIIIIIKESNLLCDICVFYSHVNGVCCYMLLSMRLTATLVVADK